MKAMILAAGFGERLWPLTADRTKPALPVLGKPLVGYVAEYLAGFGIKDVVVNLHHAYRRPEFRDRPYASFHTGPSATADIEGVLIHGAQGVRSLSLLPIARTAGNAAV